jgi:hypothetical protein
MLQTCNSHRSSSKRYAQPMTENSEQKWRQERLTELARIKGGKAVLGRLLGFRDGAYIGQMIDGHRPITEKLIDKVQGLHGLGTWFFKDANQYQPPVAREAWPQAPKTPRECLDGLEAILAEIDPATRHEIGDLLNHFARGLRPATKEAIVAVIDGAGKEEQQKAA